MTALDLAKSELRAALEGEGLSPSGIARLSPAIARYVAAAVRRDRERREARTILESMEALVRAGVGSR
jgi:hypothetical protein